MWNMPQLTFICVMNFAFILLSTGSPLMKLGQFWPLLPSPGQTKCYMTAKSSLPYSIYIFGKSKKNWQLFPLIFFGESQKYDRGGGFRPPPHPIGLTANNGKWDFMDWFHCWDFANLDVMMALFQMCNFALLHTCTCRPGQNMHLGLLSLKGKQLTQRERRGPTAQYRGRRARGKEKRTQRKGLITQFAFLSLTLFVILFKFSSNIQNNIFLENVEWIEPPRTFSITRFPPSQVWSWWWLKC